MATRDTPRFLPLSADTNPAGPRRNPLLSDAWDEPDGIIEAPWYEELPPPPPSTRLSAANRWTGSHGVDDD